MKKLIFALCLLYPAFLLADGIDPVVMPELKESWTKDMESTAKIMVRVGKVVVGDVTDGTVDPVPAAADKDAGFILFNRNYSRLVYYTTKPAQDEIKSGHDFSIHAAQGEYEPIVIGLYPLADMDLSVAVSDLVNESGDKLEASNFDIRVVKHMLKSTETSLVQVTPERMIKENPIKIRKGVTKQIWMELKVPDSAKPGIYKGKATLKGKGSATVNLSVEVYPFKLLINPDYSVGWYGCPNQEGFAMDDFIKHGNTHVWFPSPNMKYEGGSINIDFGPCEKCYDLLKKYDLVKFEHCADILGSADFITSNMKVKELSPEFNKYYVEILQKRYDWQVKKGLRMNYAICDEPRESMLNPWNRNLHDSLEYIKLFRQVKGARCSIDPMGDGDGKLDYSVLSDLLDVMLTHCWDGSRKLIEKAKKNKIGCWFYNSGRNRFSFGALCWKHKINGRLEYAYTAWDIRTAYSPESFTAARGGDPYDGIVYPTATEMQSTPYYEWTREGTDDYNYLYTLDQAVLRASASSKKEAQDEAKKAKDWLEALRERIPQYSDSTDTVSSPGAKPKVDLDEMRAKAAQELIKLLKY